METNKTNSETLQMEQRIVSLRKLIKSAFADTAGARIHDCITDRRDDERLEIAAAFGGEAWDEVGLECLLRYPDAWCFFTNLSYRTFLPAYLLGALEYHREPDSFEDSIMVSLTPPDDGDPQLMQLYKERHRGFSAKQCEAIVSWIEFMRDLKPGWYSPRETGQAVDFFAKQAEQLRLAEHERSARREKRQKRKKGKRR